MLLGSSKDGKLEMIWFSIPTTSVTVSTKGCTSGLTAPGSFNTYPMRDGSLSTLSQSCQHYDFSSRLRFFQHPCDFSTIFFSLPAFYDILSTIFSFVSKFFPPTSLIDSLKTVLQFSKYCTGQLSRPTT